MTPAPPDQGIDRCKSGTIRPARCSIASGTHDTHTAVHPRPAHRALSGFQDRPRTVVLSAVKALPRGFDRKGFVMPATTRNLATLAQLADEYSLTVRTIRSWISAGLLTAFRVGPRFIRVDREEFENLVTRRIPTARR